MAKKSLSTYERGVISSYYKHSDEIMISKISASVTELYLAKTVEKKRRLWNRVHKAMKRLKIKPAIMNHIMKSKDVEILAKNLQDWLSEKR